MHLNLSLEMRGSRCYFSVIRDQENEEERQWQRVECQETQTQIEINSTDVAVPQRLSKLAPN